MKPRTGSPVVGYNTGVQYGGKTYHIQTEDSGREHPHVITHLFADGGRVIATRRTSYAPYLSTANYPAMVKEIVLVQHKAMFVALRDGDFDAVLAASPDAASPRHVASLDVGALERALERANRSSTSDGRDRAPPATDVGPRMPERGSTKQAPPIASEQTAPASSPRIPVAAPSELTIDDLILAELTAFLGEPE